MDFVVYSSMVLVLLLEEIPFVGLMTTFDNPSRARTAATKNLLLHLLSTSGSRCDFNKYNTATILPKLPKTKHISKNTKTPPNTSLSVSDTSTKAIAKT